MGENIIYSFVPLLIYSFSNVSLFCSLIYLALAICNKPQKTNRILHTRSKYLLPFQGAFQWKIFVFFFLLTCFGCKDYQPAIPKFDYAKIAESKFEHYTNVDSTLQRFSTIKKTNEHLDSLFYCVELLINNNIEAALEYAKEANRLASEKGKTIGSAASYYYMASLKGKEQIQGENLEGAIVDAEIAKKLFEDSDENIWKVEVTRLLGNLHYKKYEFDKAETYLLESLELVEKYNLPVFNSKKLQGEIFHTLANVYSSDDSTYDKTIDLFNQSLKLYEETNNELAISRLRLSWAKLLAKKKKYNEADSLYQLSLAYVLKNTDNYLISTVYSGLGRLKYDQFKKTKDLLFYQKALDYYQKSLLSAKDNLYFIYNRIGYTYHYKASTIHEQLSDIDSAIIYYSKALNQARIEGVFKVMPRIVRNISSLCEDRLEMNNEDCKVLIGQNYTTLINETYSAINTEMIEDLELANQRSNEFERKIIAVENNRRIQNQRFLGLGLLLMTSLIFLIILQFFRQKRLKAKMEALRAQINPHFISNSLNAIESLVNLDEKESASKYIIHFSRLTRQILNGSREAFTTLEEELKMLEHFLALEQLRFRDKLSYTIQVEDDIHPKLFEIPSMILQPYVENAIWHGIKPKDGIGLLQIKVKKSNKELHFTIEDNGVGRAKAAELKAASVLQQKSIGMQINHERLQAVGKVRGSKLEIEDLFDDNGNPAGTRVLLRLPLKIKKQQI